MEKEKKFENEMLNAMLLAAVDEGNLNSIKVALKSGADVNAKNNDGWTPLHYAAHNKDKRIAELLMNNKADVNLKNNDGWTPLHYAALNLNKEVAKLLLDHGADVNARDEDGWTPLHIAAINEDKELAQLLIEHGADVNAIDARFHPILMGWTPLHYAMHNKDKELAKFLAENGADIRIKDKEGNTPLDYGDKELNSIILNAVKERKSIDREKLKNREVENDLDFEKEILKKFWKKSG